jgi:hypothetical protein
MSKINLITALVVGKPVDVEDIYVVLYEICDDEHDVCSSYCPVFKVNGGIPNYKNTASGCDCFKDGKLMYDLIKEKYSMKLKMEML